MKLNVHQIRKILPHRYPFLLVDRVEDIEFGQRIHAIKNVTVNEPFFPGHFPDYPVFPGVLIMEALAQAAAILTFASASDEETKNAADDLYLFAGIDNARFKRPVMPGDRLELFAEMTASKRGIYKYKAVAKVDGQVVAEADLMCAHRKMGDA
ncbi:MAG: 3-hydroxyacyl-ACP dehydratase FabZ [Rhodocyclaceae bacterium]|nr:3-hydroxyacyl-ACP dehydratase FabZ [Rhodocyclaceae bacterium]